jgi:hypothetical protein
VNMPPMNAASTRDRARATRQEELLRNVEAEIKSLRYGRVVVDVWLDVRPVPALHDGPDGMLGDAEPIPDILQFPAAIVSQPPDLSHLLLGQQGVLVRATPRLPALRYLVGYVVPGRPEEQVGRIYTGRIVAMVENPQAVRDRPVVEFPREAVRPNVLPVRVVEGSIARAPRVAKPQPALVALLDKAPKPFFGRALPVGVVASLRAELAGDGGARPAEGAAAIRAGGGTILTHLKFTPSGAMGRGVSSTAVPLILSQAGAS